MGFETEARVTDLEDGGFSVESTLFDAPIVVTHGDKDRHTSASGSIHYASCGSRAPLALKEVAVVTVESGYNAGRRVADDPRAEMEALHTLRASTAESPLLPFHGVLRTPESFFMVMDRGRCSLLDVVGSCSVEDARRYILGLLRGLEFIHAEGYAHCDVSLENGVLRGQEAHLIDFGCATRVGADGCLPCRPTRGKSLYRSPESLRRDNDSVNGAAHDVWAFGVCVFSLLFGAPPFSFATAACPLFALHAADRASPALRRFVLEDFPTAAAAGEEALDFALWVLDPNPATRPSLAAVKTHPWLATAPAAPTAGVGAPTKSAPPATAEATPATTA